jgi:hypothetical protein
MIHWPGIVVCWWAFFAAARSFQFFVDMMLVDSSLVEEGKGYRLAPKLEPEFDA